jgi:hypothetical protein
MKSSWRSTTTTRNDIEKPTELRYTEKSTDFTDQTKTEMLLSWSDP